MASNIEQNGREQIDSDNQEIKPASPQKPESSNHHAASNLDGNSKQEQPAEFSLHIDWRAALKKLDGRISMSDKTTQELEDQKPPEQSQPKDLAQMSLFLDGNINYTAKKTETLAEQAQEFTFASGDKVYAGTDAGIDYKNGPNEDGILVNSAENLVVVADGLGGYAAGHIATRIICEEIYKQSQNIPQGLLNAKYALQKQFPGLISEFPGACLIATKLETIPTGKKYLHIFQSGDVKMFIRAKNGQIRHESKDQSTLQDLIDYEKNPDKQAKLIAQATYHSKRNLISEYISQKSSYHTHYLLQVYAGERIYIYSDGLGDNFTPLEILNLSHNLDNRQTMQVLSDKSGQRMQNRDKIIDYTIHKYIAELSKLGLYNLDEKQLRSLQFDQTLEFQKLLKPYETFALLPESFQLGQIIPALIHEIDLLKRYQQTQAPLTLTGFYAALEARHRLGRFADGYSSMPKTDNRALAIIDVV